MVANQRRFQHHEAEILLDPDIHVEEPLHRGLILRDAGRDEKCKTWGRSLRTREIGSVEYRYRVEGSTSSVFIDRSVCG